MKTAKEVLADQMDVPALRDVPLVAYIELYFKRPKCHYKKGQLREDAPKYVIRPTRNSLMKTPDVDNCTKFVLDALQPRVVHDDKFVSMIVVEKLWCETDTAQRTMIELHVRV
jgi:Holliday junction resolvase RusA-like endonuclease